MGVDVRIASLVFRAATKESEVSFFRGAVLNMVKDLNTTLFHNHTENDGYNYAYPLIQYKSQKGHGAILFINQAIEQIGPFLSIDESQLKIGHRMENLYPATVSCRTFDVDRSEEPLLYELKSWIPLNSSNYSKYQDLKTLSERVEMLSHILIGNLISFLKGLGMYADFEIQVDIQDFQSKEVRVKETSFKVFDLTFWCNLSLPDGIGIGKSASKGFGVIKIKN